MRRQLLLAAALTAGACTAETEPQLTDTTLPITTTLDDVFESTETTIPTSTDSDSATPDSIPPFGITEQLDPEQLAFLTKIENFNNYEPSEIARFTASNGRFFRCIRRTQY